MSNDNILWLLANSKDRRLSQHELATISRSNSLGIISKSQDLIDQSAYNKSFEIDLEKDKSDPLFKMTKGLPNKALLKKSRSRSKTNPFSQNSSKKSQSDDDFMQNITTTNSFYDYIRSPAMKSEYHELASYNLISQCDHRLSDLKQSYSYPQNSPKRLMLLLNSNPVDIKNIRILDNQYTEEPKEEYSSPKSPPSTKLTKSFSFAETGLKKDLKVRPVSEIKENVPKAVKYIEKFTITILNVNHNRSLNPSYVVITFGDKVFRTATSKAKDGNWNETFEFDVSYHYQLFGTCQLDLYEYSWYMPDTHKGRAEIRLASLKNFPESFKNYYELYDKQYSLGTISELARRTKPSQNLGAIQVKIQYKFMNPVNRKSFLQTKLPIDTKDSNFNLNTSPNINDLENQLEFRDARDIENEQNLHEALINPSANDHFNKIENDSDPGKDPYSFGRVSLISGDAESIQDKYLNNEENDDSMFNFVGSYIISKSTQAVLKGITRVYMAFNQGLELKNIEFFGGILLLEKYFLRLAKKAKEDEKTATESSIPRNFIVAEEAHYFYKYALAAYGWRGLVFFRKIPPINKGQIISDHDAVKVYLSLKDSCLLGYEFRSNEIFQPTYFIALDEQTNSLVVSIRGTMSVIDTLTDLVCEYEPWRGGLVHSGILAVAQSLMRSVMPNVMAHAIQHQVHKIIIVGHSLGGASASILTMMLLDHLHEFRLPNPNFEVRCYAYGPPPCTSNNLAASPRFTPYINTIICENDLVPHLSYGAMMDFKAMILAASEITNEHSGAFLSFERFASLFQTSEEAKKAMEAQLDSLDKAFAHQLKVEHMNPKLYLAGKVYHLKAYDELLPPFDKMKRPEPSPLPSTFQLSSILPNSKPDSIFTPPYYYFLTSTSDSFLNISINSSMLTDHLPSSYDLALSKCVELINELKDNN